MRAAILLCLTGCFDPTGATQAWPPPLGIQVEAVASGDLDGDGVNDIVVIASGGESTAGAYLLRGNTDIVLGPGTTGVRSFTTFTPATVSQPAALQLASPPKLYLESYAEDGAAVSLTTVDARLAHGTIDPRAVGITSSAVLWGQLVTFPGNMARIVVSNGSDIHHLTTAGGDDKLVPPPSGATWTNAQTATTYASGAAQIIVVATADSLQHSPLPSAAGGAFTWTALAHPPLVGQTAVDLDGDGVPEILGLDPAARSLCALDPEADSNNCFAGATAFAGNEVTLVAGVNFTPNSAPDLVIVQSTPTETQYSVIEDYVFSGGLFNTGTPRALPASSPAHARPVVVNGGVGTPNALLTIAPDGTVTCVFGAC